MRNTQLAQRLAYRASQSDNYARSLEEKDGKSCTVIALQALTGCSYIEAYEALKGAGRTLGRGLSVNNLDEYVKCFTDKNFSLTRVYRWDNENNFLVLTRDHACAMVKGAYVNGLGRAQITHLFKVTKNA